MVVFLFGDALYTTANRTGEIIKPTVPECSYDNFIGPDGKFDDNVMLQIKNGPMDFQVREPVSTLFGGLKKTNNLRGTQFCRIYRSAKRCVLPHSYVEGNT